MKIATWNVNSIKARLEPALAWLKAADPDVLCLQEIKTVDENFPREAFESLGYSCAVHGQKSYNGVAILSRQPIEDVTPRLPAPDGVLDSGIVAHVNVASGAHRQSDARVNSIVHFTDAPSVAVAQDLHEDFDVAVHGSQTAVDTIPLDLLDGMIFLRRPEARVGAALHRVRRI